MKSHTCLTKWTLTETILTSDYIGTNIYNTLLHRRWEMTLTETTYQQKEKFCGPGVYPRGQRQRCKIWFDHIRAPKVTPLSFCTALERNGYRFPTSSESSERRYAIRPREKIFYLFLSFFFLTRQPASKRCIECEYRGVRNTWILPFFPFEKIYRKSIYLFLRGEREKREREIYLSICMKLLDK